MIVMRFSNLAIFKEKAKFSGFKGSKVNLKVKQYPNVNHKLIHIDRNINGYSDDKILGGHY